MKHLFKIIYVELDWLGLPWKVLKEDGSTLSHHRSYVEAKGAAWDYYGKK